jgi:hypothetical protein
MRKEFAAQIKPPRHSHMKNLGVDVGPVYSKKTLILLVLGLTIIFTLCFSLTIFRQISPLFHLNGELRISDFAYYSEVTRAFWSGEYDQIYSLEVLQKFSDNLAAQKVAHLLPVNITPIGFIELALLTTSFFPSLSVCQSLFLGFSYALFVSVIWYIAACTQYRLSIYVVVVAFMVSPINQVITATGQFSVLIAALLLLQLQLLSSSKVRTPYLMGELVLPLLIACKPHYFFLSLFFVGIFRGLRTTLFPLTAFLICVLALTHKLGINWVSSYLYASFLFHLKQGAASEFDGSFVPQLKIFKYAFAQWFSTTALSVIGAGIILVTSVSLTLMRGRLSLQEKYIAACLVVGVVSLFAPFWPVYDEFLLILCLAPIFKSGPLTSVRIVILVIMISSVLMPQTSNMPIVMAWLLKMSLIGVVAYFSLSVKAQEKTSLSV